MMTVQLDPARIAVAVALAQKPELMELLKGLDRLSDKQAKAIAAAVDGLPRGTYEVTSNGNIVQSSSIVKPAPEPTAKPKPRPRPPRNQRPIPTAPKAVPSEPHHPSDDDTVVLPAVQEERAEDKPPKKKSFFENIFDRDDPDLIRS